MSMMTTWPDTEPTRGDVNARAGLLLLEFGSARCGWCQAAQPRIATALDGHSQVDHLKVADGPGRPLGRSFRVKLWPTLIFLRDGQEIARLVRPDDATAIAASLDTLTAAQ